MSSIRSEKQAEMIRELKEMHTEDNTRAFRSQPGTTLHPKLRFSCETGRSKPPMKTRSETEAHSLLALLLTDVFIRVQTDLGKGSKF